MAKSATAKAPPPGKADSSSAPRSKKSVKVHDDYTSDGVEDNDILLLPVSDYQVMLLVTVLGAIVRLFRIYQPTSVVFDEVQYVDLLPSFSPPLSPSFTLSRLSPLAMTCSS